MKSHIYMWRILASYDIKANYDYLLIVVLISDFIEATLEKTFLLGDLRCNKFRELRCPQNRFLMSQHTAYTSSQHTLSIAEVQVQGAAIPREEFSCRF